MARAGIELNGVRYRWPSRPVVVVCIDGGDPAYFDRGVRDGVVPNVARFMKTGFAAVADGDVPSFTRSEENTSELQSRLHLVCRLLLEKKKKKHDGTGHEEYARSQ